MSCRTVKSLLLQALVRAKLEQENPCIDEVFRSPLDMAKIQFQTHETFYLIRAWPNFLLHRVEHHPQILGGDPSNVLAVAAICCTVS